MAVEGAVPRETARATGPRLREFVERLEREHPEQVVHVTQPIDPARFDATAVLQQLESRGKFPLVVFDRPRDVLGEPSAFPLVANAFATRERCALSLGLRTDDAGLPLSVEYARREQLRIPPEIVPADRAPVRDVVRQGDDVDLRRFPVVRQHEMDGGPYLDMACVLRHRDSGAYNTAFLRNQLKGPRRLGLHMSPRHSLRIQRAYEDAGEPTPIAIVLGHHPAFYVGALNVLPFGVDDHHVIGAMLQRPLRVTPSVTWGDRFLVPADAEIVVEGVIPPGVREVEGPFGEFPGTYGPQRVRWTIDVTAVSHRRDALFQAVFSGHPDTWVLGAFPKEGHLYQRIKGHVPGVTAVHLPTSAVGRFHCYISLAEHAPGDAKRAALIALGEVDFIKHVFVVDADIDVFRERDVLWAVATRVQADEDVAVISGVKGSQLDPSQRDDGMGAKMIVDATKPHGRPFEARVAVPEEALRRIDIDRLIPRDQLERSV